MKTLPMYTSVRKLAGLMGMDRRTVTRMLDSEECMEIVGGRARVSVAKVRLRWPELYADMVSRKLDAEMFDG